MSKTDFSLKKILLIAKGVYKDLNNIEKLQNEGKTDDAEKMKSSLKIKLQEIIDETERKMNSGKTI